MLLALGLALGTVPSGAAAAVAATPSAPESPHRWGVYVGPGAKNVTGRANFEAWSGLPITDVIDFPPTGAWTSHNGVTGPTWLLNPYKGTNVRLEYSLPMLPDVAGTSLAACAAGEYDAYWAETGRNLVAAGKTDTIVRPGWEFNGNWYRWSAAGKTEAFIGCFRTIVTTMRAVAGNEFTYDWNPTLGPGSFAAELAYPGDAYVDYIGIDVYDTSWTWYPTPGNTTLSAARDSAWAYIKNGSHGLEFWRAFATARGKPLAVPEWGSTFRTDGHGGGDNPVFMARMLDWMAANDVAYSHYFNVDAGVVAHDLMRSDTRFPVSGEIFRDKAAAWVAAEAARSAATPAPAEPTPSATPEQLPSATPTVPGAPTSGATPNLPTTQAGGNGTPQPTGSTPTVPKPAPSTPKTTPPAPKVTATVTVKATASATVKASAKSGSVTATATASASASASASATVTASTKAAAEASARSKATATAKARAATAARTKATELAKSRALASAKSKAKAKAVAAKKAAIKKAAIKKAAIKKAAKRKAAARAALKKR